VQNNIQQQTQQFGQKSVEQLPSDMRKQLSLFSLRSYIDTWNKQGVPFGEQYKLGVLFPNVTPSDVISELYRPRVEKDGPFKMGDPVSQALEHIRYYTNAGAGKGADLGKAETKAIGGFYDNTVKPVQQKWENFANYITGAPKLTTGQSGLPSLNQYDSKIKYPQYGDTPK